MLHAKAFLKAANKTEDSVLIGVAYFYLSNACFHFKRNYKSFSNYIQQALLYLQNTDEVDYLMQVYNLLGIDANTHGNVQLSVDCFNKALSVSPDMEPNYLTAMIHFNIGQVYFQIEEYKQALRYVKASHQIIHKNKLDDPRNMEGYCYCFEGTVNLLLGRLNSAHTCLNGLNKLIARSENPDAAALDPFFLLFQLRMCHEDGDIEKRDQLIAIFLQQLLHDGLDLESITEILDFIGFMIKIEDYESAKIAIDHMMPLIENADIPNIQVPFLSKCVEYYSRTNQEDQYIRALSEYYRFAENYKVRANKIFSAALQTRMALEAVEKENARLTVAANTDGLTGIPNRSALNTYLDEIFEDCYHLHLSLGIEFLDIDFFKEYNDTYGHQAGDKVLTRVADILKDIAVDERIYVGRYGGDEFVLVYRDMTDDEIMSIAESIRNRVLALEIEHKYSQSGPIVSVSQGIRNRVPKSGNKLWDFLYTADNALYQVKKNKKGQIMLMHTAFISTKSLEDSKSI